MDCAELLFRQCPVDQDCSGDTIHGSGPGMFSRGLAIGFLGCTKIAGNWGVQCNIPIFHMVESYSGTTALIASCRFCQWARCRHQAGLKCRNAALHATRISLIRWFWAICLMTPRIKAASPPCGQPNAWAFPDPLSPHLQARQSD